MTRRTAAAVLIALLSAFVVIGLCGLDWGLPSRRGWAVDELIPLDVLDGVEQRFSGGWYRRYPPFHYYTLTVLYAPVLLHAGWKTGQTLPLGDYHRLFLLGRGLSLLMAAITVFLIYRLGREFLNRPGALFAASLVAFMPPFVFYAGLVNLDVPYVFWWSLSLVFLMRALQRGLRRDYVLWAVASALAVTTKDQILASYVLVVPWIVLVRYRRLKEAGGRRAFLRAALGRDLLAAGACAALIFLAVHNPAGNPAGARAHFEDILSDGSRRYREYTGDLAGQAGLLWTTLANIRFTLGDAGLWIGLVGVALASIRRSRPLPLQTLLVIAASYYVFFIAVALYCYDRFVVPLCVCLALCAGWALRIAFQRFRRRQALLLAVAFSVVAFGAARAATVAWLRVKDSRHETAAWLGRNAEGSIAIVGPPIHLPLIEGFRARWINAKTSRVLRFNPDYVVINADYADRAMDGSEAQMFYSSLRAGELGYCRVYQNRGVPPFDVLGLEAIRSGSVSSNLKYVNPLMQVYRRCRRRERVAF
jgi:hypothetical protein